MPASFRSSVWDPVLITSQIICLQCVFYVSAGFWVALFDLMFGYSIRLGQLFSFSNLKIRDTEGRLLLVAFLMTSLILSLGLWRIVKRTKQCLDFACTTHLYHLVFCWMYNSHIPNTFLWWCINVVSIILTTVIGEFLCMRSELKAIPLGPKANL